eukprot:SAG22_NODE_8241_length_671_cov_2.833916_1_plen_83_part_00
MAAVGHRAAKHLLELRVRIVQLRDVGCSRQVLDPLVDDIVLRDVRAAVRPSRPAVAVGPLRPLRQRSGELDAGHPQVGVITG